MTEPVARRYLDHLSRHAAILVSINHEAWPAHPHALVLERTPRVLRYPYWMRRGYVEEIAFFEGDGLQPNRRP